MNQIKLKKPELTMSQTEIIKRIIKYVIIGFAVALAARYIPKDKIQLIETIMIGIVASCSFALLDMYAPTVNFNLS